MTRTYAVITLFTFLTSTLYASSDDVYYRTLYCNAADKKEEIKELPPHFLKVCANAQVDPATIHVYKTDDGSRMPHTIGRNIMIPHDMFTDPFYATEEEQAWEFAHELSHVMHNDHKKKWSSQFKLFDFQIGSSAMAVLYGLYGLHKQTLRVPGAIRLITAWGVANVSALYAYYQTVQAIELRAHEDASRFTSPEAGLSILGKVEWAKRNNNTLSGRLNWHLERLGFDEHGSSQAQIDRVKKAQQQQKADNY